MHYDTDPTHFKISFESVPGEGPKSGDLDWNQDYIIKQGLT